MKNKVSVIIPAYNVENYIEDCIGSVMNQTYKNFEIIVINDGSTDNTLEILRKLEKKYDCIEVIDIENNGQGYARNMALKKATGDFIMFLDSDDFIEPVTFEVAVKRIVEDDSDFVNFDWKYYKTEKNKYSYVSKEKFYHKKVLVGDECRKLLGIQHYFTVNKLYRKSYLLRNKILYGEHYIYEDILFWMHAVIKAKKVSLIQSPLYSVRINDTSTTKSNYHTDRHLRGFLQAYDDCFKLITDDMYVEISYLLEYFIKKFLVYYTKRTPKRLKQEFLDEFFNRIKDFDFNKLKTRSRFIKMGIKMHALNNKNCFKLFIGLYSSKKYYRKAVNLTKKAKRLVKHDNNINEKAFKTCSHNLKEQILFLGFDYRYTGNSRYLYEKMLKNAKYPLYFATTSKLVDERMRVEPNTKEFYELLYSSKVVIFESWIPKKLEKPNGATWINLWHGTPLKKMLYDSNEEEIVIKNPNQKKDKFLAIEKIDYLLTDNVSVNHYFETSFLFNKDHLLSYGYPRVEYLIKNKNNKKLKEQLRKELNIPKKKKIVTYLPTWRDYNYDKSKEFDYDYLLDKDALSECLNAEYVIVSKDHSFLRRADNVTVTEMETQELLLVSDYLVTDYSSVMFDGFAVDIPVCILAKDYDKYSLSRGLYEDMWEYLKPFAVDNEKDLAHLIKNYKLDKNYNKVKEKYGYKSDGNLVAFINKAMKEEK